MNQEIKKSEEAINEEKNGVTEQNTEQQTEEKTDAPDITTAEGQIEMFRKGKLTLFTPIMSRGKEVTELFWDFAPITGREYAEALDKDRNARGSFALTGTQALYLFAKAVEKAMVDLDAKDVAQRIGAQDSIQGIQLATVFFAASRQAGYNRITKV